MSFEYIWGDFHWGGNWGYEIFRERVAFAHLLVADK
jgi:poly-gamma-glutamate capsule biosynthesis protein CapA/YwtB (metallophosphatase superfamily)